MYPIFTGRICFESVNVATFFYPNRISRTDEEAKDENRFGTRDESRFGTRDESRFGTRDERRSRFDRGLNERPQKGLSEKFAPER